MNTEGLQSIRPLLANFSFADETLDKNDDSDSSLDYTSTDGLLMCGVCHSPKQYRLHLPAELGGQVRLVRCICRCQEARLAEEERQRQLAEDRERIKLLHRQSLMDAAFRQCTFDHATIDANNRRAVSFAKTYTERFDEMLQKNRGILFLGPPGTGKTYLAACIANALLDQGIPVLMTSFVKLNQWTGRPMDDSGLLEAMDRAHLLVLDDLGAERDTDYSVERVYNVVDNRIRAGRPMILTTNLSLDEMKYQSDIRRQRIYDRIFQHCYLQEMNGTSRRRRDAAKLYREMERMMNDHEKENPS